MIFFSRKRVKDFKDYYKNSSIQHIISVSFTAVAMVGILLVGISLYLRYTNAAMEMASENNRAVLEQVNMNLDSYLRNMMKVSDSMYYRVIKKTDLAKADINYELGLLYEANKDYIVGITLFSEAGKVVDGYPLTQLKKSVDPRDTKWFSDAVNRKENLHFSTPHVQNLFVDPTFNYHWVVSLSRSVELIFDGAIESGVLLVDMNFRGIEQICKNANVGKDGYVYLIDNNGELIYHPRQQLIYSNLIEENNTKVASFEDGVTVDELRGEKRLVTVKTVGYTGWKIVGVTPMKSLTAGYYETRVFVVFIMVFALFILISLNMFIASRITNPIRALEGSVKKLENGVKDVDISISGS
ncbi:MAG: cache domain-containing protein, partial [Clostridium sp.]